MKKIFTTSLLLCMLNLTALGQTFKVDTLYKTGPDSNRINIVILGDGFTKEQMPDFLAEARKFADFFLSYTPYNHYKEYFNVFAISTPSQESGVTNPGTAPDAYKDQPVGVKRTFYGATFGSSIHRLVTANYAVAFGVLASNFPEYDLAVMIVNTTYYGGSGGGSIAVHTLNQSADLIGVHEIGHSFTSLSDEYWAGSQYGREAANMTKNSDPAIIRWRNWLNLEEIGIYKHSESGDASTWHKPANGTCLMEYLDKQFCAVCREATAERILSIIHPFDKVTPPITSPVEVGNETTFSLDLLKPSPNSLKVEWKLDNKMIGDGQDQITLSSNDFGGNAILTASVFDSTFMSRVDDAPSERTFSVEWKVVSTNPAVFAVSAASDTICEGQFTTITARNCAGPVSWSNNQTGETITVNPEVSTTYTATCQGPGNSAATSNATVTVLETTPATATNDGPYFIGDTIHLKASEGHTFLWSGPRNFSATTQETFIPGAQLTNAGTYQVKVIDRNRCESTAQTVVMVDAVLAVEPAGDWVQLAPNPATDHVIVQSSSNEESLISFFDVSGKKLKSVHFQKNATIDLDGIRGTIIYRVENKTQKTFSGTILIP